MANNKCYTCGSNDIVLDESTCESQLVCTSCGTVLQECSSLSAVNTAGTSYTSNDGINVHMSANLLKRNLGYKAVAPGKKQGLEKISQLASILNFSEDMQERATKLFSHAYSKEFRTESIAKKLILGASCAYVVMRENDSRVIFEDLFQHLSCKPKEFLSVYKRLEKCIHLKVSHQTTDDFVNSVLRDAKLGDEKLISRKAVEILNICRECWVTSGRSRRHTVIAAVYIAWISSDFSRGNVKFRDFYSKFSFPKVMYRTATLRVQEMYSVFIKHAKQLPWVKDSNVNSKNIFLHVDHVLKYFKSLHDGVLSEASSSNCDADILQYKVLHPQSGKHKQCQGTLGPDTDYKNSDNSYNDYISDTEIDTYIRTEAEVAKYCELKDDIKATRENS